MRGKRWFKLLIPDKVFEDRMVTQKRYKEASRWARGMTRILHDILAKENEKCYNQSDQSNQAKCPTTEKNTDTEPKTTI